MSESMVKRVRRGSAILLAALQISPIFPLFVSHHELLFTDFMSELGRHESQAIGFLCTLKEYVGGMVIAASIGSRSTVSVQDRKLLI